MLGRAIFRDIIDPNSAVIRQQLITKIQPHLDPKCAAMVIVESVDKVALNRLVKAQMVTQEEADLCGIAKIDYAYIIR